jgi:hypothetical protein
VADKRTSKVAIPGPENVRAKAMTEMKPISNSRSKAYKVAIILLVAVAAYSSAMKDLNRLQELAGNIHEFTTELLGGLPIVHAAAMPLAGNSCANVGPEANSVEGFRWNGRVAPGASIEIKGVNGDISAEPNASGNVEVLANKKARRDDPGSVDIKVIEHAGGVTICVMYPSEDPNNPNTCEPGKGGHMNVRHNDVRVDFSVKVPAGVGFMGRTVNGEISATALSGNVISNTVNGSIKISTSGYAQAKTVNGEISAKLGNANWPDAIEFKTVNGAIALDLPATTSSEVEAETFNGDISSDFPLSLPGTINRKHVSGRIGNGGRELIVKTLNGSISLRRSS